MSLILNMLIYYTSDKKKCSLFCCFSDAAHRVHPLAGQGANLGFSDVSCLRGQLKKAIREGADIGKCSQMSSI